MRYPFPLHKERSITCSRHFKYMRYTQQSRHAHRIRLSGRKCIFENLIVYRTQMDRKWVFHSAEYLLLQCPKRAACCGSLQTTAGPRPRNKHLKMIRFLLLCGCCRLAFTIGCFGGQVRPVSRRGLFPRTRQINFITTLARAQIYIRNSERLADGNSCVYEHLASVFDTIELRSLADGTEPEDIHTGVYMGDRYMWQEDRQVAAGCAAVKHEVGFITKHCRHEPHRHKLTVSRQVRGDDFYAPVRLSDMTDTQQGQHPNEQQS